MSQRENPRYVHSGSALALGGHLTHPFAGPIPSQGACAVPGCGGFSSMSVGGFDYQGLVSFEGARVRCLANHERKEGYLHHYTVSTVSIDGVNILDVVKAANITARLLAVAKTPIPGEGGEGKSLRYSTVGSSFTDLRVPGLSRGFSLQAVTGDAPQEGAALARQSLAAEGYAEARSRGIFIEDFGTVFLAEFFPGPYTARLIMLRVELGCPAGGTATFGEVKDGGVDWP